MWSMPDGRSKKHKDLLEVFPFINDFKRFLTNTPFADSFLLHFTSYVVSLSCSFPATKQLSRFIYICILVLSAFEYFVHKFG